MRNNQKQQKSRFPLCETYYHFNLDFQKEGRCLIHGTKGRKYNQLQSLEFSCRIS